MLTRRHILQTAGQGFGALALASLEAAETPQRAQVVVPRAKRVVQLFMGGAASHIDLFDFKPELVKHHGEASDFGEKVEAFQNGLGPWKKPVWDFKPYGRCGKMLSDAVAPLGACADDMAFVHNMVGKTGVHSQGTLLQATGFNLPGFPGMGCWVSYALGSLSENLPAFVVLPDHRGFASNGPKNWDSAFLPSQHAGTIIYPGAETPISDLFPHKSGRYITPQSDREGFALLEQLNRKHQQQREEDARLDSRIKSYELAAKMQTAAKEALDISGEPEHVKKLYGVDNPITKDYATRSIIARRLVERGVRYVQVLNSGQSWDQHGSLVTALPKNCEATDQPSAALIIDLKQRGLLDSTVVHWGGEMGRLPVLQNDAGRAKWGRDHNTYGFSQWVAGGGFKRGYVHGETDEWSHHAVIDEVHHYDWHATLLHNFGLDHRRLTFKRNGLAASLTDNQGAKVVKKLLA